MSFDALMRWEWEGGTPTSGNDPAEAAHTKPAENTHTRLQPTNRRQKARRVASVSPPLLPWERRQGDDSEH